MGRPPPDAGSSGGGLAVLVELIRAPDRASDLLAAVPTGAVAPLVGLARAHGVEPWLARYAPRRRPGWEPVDEQRTALLAARARTRSTLRDVGEALGAAGVEWLVMKGQALAEDVYPSPDLRFGSDIDVLVHPHEFGAAVGAFDACGWELIDRNWPLLAQHQPGELRFRSRSGILIDLHWSVLNEPALRANFTMPTAPLLARRRTLASGLPVLDRVDQLIHLGVHGSLSGANRLMWLADAQFAAATITDWDELAARADRSRASLALALVLERGRPLGGFRPVGAPRRWVRLCRAVDRVSPLAARPTVRSLSGAFARATRATAGASIVELSRHGLRFVGEGARWRRPPSPLLDPDDRRGPMFPVRDPAARESYFRIVARAGRD